MHTFAISAASNLQGLQLQNPGGNSNDRCRTEVKSTRGPSDKKLAS